MRQTDIVMVTWYRPEMSELVIKTLKKNTKREAYRLIVIDNGSPREQQEMLKGLQDNGYIDNLILNETNRGLEPARNQGLEAVETERFVCADNDCLVERPRDGLDWLERLNLLMDEYPGYAAISLRTQVMIGTGNIFEGKEDEDVLDFAHPGGSFRLMDTASVRQVGGWREDSLGRGSEERYICGELRQSGWLTGFAVNINCLHLFGSRSEGQETDRWGYPKSWTPQETGHSDISHPALTQGDDQEEIARYA